MNMSHASDHYRPLRCQSNKTHLNAENLVFSPEEERPRSLDTILHLELSCHSSWLDNAFTIMMATGIDINLKGSIQLT